MTSPNISSQLAKKLDFFRQDVYGAAKKKYEASNDGEFHSGGLFDYLNLTGVYDTDRILDEIAELYNQANDDKIAADRYIDTDDGILFQTENGNILKYDMEQGQFDIVENDVDTLLASYGLNTSGDMIDFNKGHAESYEFTFNLGSDDEADTTTYNGKTTKELDLTSSSGQAEVTSIIQEYLKDHGGKLGSDGLKAIFGDESGKSANVVYGDNPDVAFVMQGDEVYQISADGSIKKNEDLANSYIGNDNKLHLVNFQQGANTNFEGVSVVIENYTLDGLLDGSISDPSIDEDKLKVLEDVVALTNAENLRDLFGAQDNVIYSKSGKYMFISQNGQLLRLGIDEAGKLESRIFTKDDAPDITGGSFAGYKINEDGELVVITSTGAEQEMDENVTGSGDPHFSYAGAGHTFDFQGAGGHTNSWNTLLEGDDFELDAYFQEMGDRTATYMTQAKLTVQTDAGAVEVITSNSAIQSATLNGEDVTGQLADMGISISTGSSVSIAYDGRTISFSGSNITMTGGIQEGETGLLAQSAAVGTEGMQSDELLVKSNGSAMTAPVAITNSSDATALASDYVNYMPGGSGSAAAYTNNIMQGIDLGSISVPDGYNLESDQTSDVYTKANYSAKIAYNASVAYKNNPTEETKQAFIDAMADWVTYSSEAMVKDMTEKDGAVASRFENNHGYSTYQWNEYVGTVAFAQSVDMDRDGDLDVAIDVDGDGITDGFDIDGDGKISSDEEVLADVGHKKTLNISDDVLEDLFGLD